MVVLVQLMFVEIEQVYVLIIVFSRFGNLVIIYFMFYQSLITVYFDRETIDLKWSFESMVILKQFAFCLNKTSLRVDNSFIKV